MESVRESCCCRNYLISWHGQWVDEIFVLEKGCPGAGDVCGPCCGGPKSPTLIMLSGHAQDKSFCAVFSVGAALCGLSWTNASMPMGTKGCRLQSWWS